LKDRLAIHAAALTDRTQYRQQPTYKNDDRQYATVTFRPFKNTETVITAHSDGLGRGAAFVVRLPVLLGVDAGPAPRTRVLAPASLIGLKVLAVDDDVEARDVVASVLLMCGATVTVVGSAMEALAAVRVERPDIVLSDISMPAVDGYQLVERLRSSTDPSVAGLPVVALTAVVSEDSKRHALERGFDGYLPKPLDAAVLSHTLLEIVRTRVARSG